MYYTEYINTIIHTYNTFCLLYGTYILAVLALVWCYVGHDVPAASGAMLKNGPKNALEDSVEVNSRHLVTNKEREAAGGL